MVISRRFLVVHKGGAQLADRYITGVLGRKSLPELQVGLRRNIILGHRYPRAISLYSFNYIA
jgi:hypothetical protein